ncbi:ergothioneine biosynthesis protein EgtB [Putridiphycobacter roseus]|uniref:Ergothioneine biosynthesis protein EgtB n=1 Tax=Putridiphycobacter roseus TaxID=2219161 RepID=A0A2W1NLF7_9FLAO|nr:ergothioneine biosynthesis protein EgtB [Putridiphycobacter roseus]PZE16492.1 ergothioneine biosynthesis protein EgtB [Putridiphycobacter roseus]
MIEKYILTRKKTEALCAPLRIEDYIPQPVDFASPPKWHIAHTTWFFEEMILKRFVSDYKPFHAQYSFLFNSYYNTIGERTFRANRGNITRPGVSEVMNYRKHVDAEIQSLLGSNQEDELIKLIEIGINHEQQHQELLLTDLKFTFGHNPVFPVYDKTFKLEEVYNANSNWIHSKEGVYEIGHQGPDFCFDNELGRHKVYLQDFEIANFLVTNADFIDFIEAGGYKNFNYWLDEGWAWVNEQQVDAPLYWHKIDGEWQYYTFAGLKKVDPKAVLTHVSYYEANAYATWKGMRLPTEFEWEVVADSLDWGQRWEWTNSAYLPYPNFKIAAGAVGEYNGKFMISQMVLKGASLGTAVNHSRKTYRNFFHPKYQWQFSGIRLVK